MEKSQTPAITLEIDKPLQERCGIVGIYTPEHTYQLQAALKAGGAVQHRGQHGAGIVMKLEKRVKKYTKTGLIREIFTPSVTNLLDKPAQWTILHCRYGTNGKYLDENVQPCIATSPKGEKIAVAHNGEFVAPAKMKAKLRKKFRNGVSDTFIFTHMLSIAKGANWDERILNCLSQVDGAYSLIIGIQNVMYVARDPHGIRPLILGKLDAGYMVASESHSFTKTGATILRSLKRGEVIRIDKNGLTTIKEGTSTAGHFCDFEWAYFSRPDSRLSTNETEDEYMHPDDWLSITEFRERCGTTLAEEFPIKNADFVVGVPDSGVGIATGYANALKIPYRQVILRDHYDPNGGQRLFMRDDQMHLIKSRVLNKLSLVPDKRIWKDKIIVIGDDSIVRGNVSKKITDAIYELGAKEVHWIIGFPPIMHRCHLGVSMRTRKELIAVEFNADPKKIAEAIHAKSVHYISSRGFIRSRLLSQKPVTTKRAKEMFLKNGGCGGCVTGIYPVSRFNNLYKPS